jgi:hypothetical protein
VAASGQVSSKTKTFPLTTTKDVSPVHVVVASQTYKGKKSVRVWDTSHTDYDTKYAKLFGVQFHNGTLEVELVGQLLPTAGDSARGFVGIAFRINDSNEQFECIYLRPTNGRADDQLRRNHSVQYISHPGYPWYKLRAEFPSKYESYVDLEPGKWTKVKIEVHDNVAKLYVHGSTQPTLIVTDLKQGSDKKGSIGLWIGPGTDAYFRNLVISFTD